VDKAPDAFRTISEVAVDLNVPQHVLRFWESRFNEIKPMKRGGGRRYYRPDDVDLLRGIRHLLYGEGYTIRGVQRILKDQGLRYVQTIWQPGAAGAAAPDSEDGDFAGEETDPPEQSERGRGLFGLLPSLIGNANDVPEVKAAAQKDQKEDEDQEEEEEGDVDAETDEEEIDEEGEDEDSDYDEEDGEDEDGDEDEDQDQDEESDEDDDEEEDNDEEEDEKSSKSKQAPRPLTLRQPVQPIGGSLRAAISIDDMRKLESALDELSHCRKLLEALD
jgi:DNA-binding transcriptional MerR regulator